MGRKPCLKDRLSYDDFMSLYFGLGLSQAAIAKRFSITVGYVARLRKQYNIPVNPHVHVERVGQRNTGSKSGNLTGKITPEEMSRLYVDEGLSPVEIGERYGVSRKAVWNYLKTHDINTRCQYDARQIARQRGRIQNEPAIDDHFFSNWTPAMAWVLGLLFTDGNMSAGPNGTLVVRICSVDCDLLERIRTAMHSEHNIKLKKQTMGGTIYELGWARSVITKDLLELGLTPKKSLTIRFPEVPDSCTSHFSRGLWDGDGSVFFEPRTPHSPLRVNFTSGSRSFIETFERNLNIWAGVRRQVIYTHPTGTSFSFKYGHGDSVKLFHFLYAGDIEAIRLERKYQKFLDGIRLCET